MDRDTYDRTTQTIAAWAHSDRNVLGLVALGSTAAKTREPDQWSDHDLIVVTRTGNDRQVRDQATAWLPQPEQIAVQFTEPDHGLTVIYDNGHLIELAVCDVDDLGWLPPCDYRVIVGGAALDAHVAELVSNAAQQMALPDAMHLYHRFLVEVLIGSCRLRRGEWLSANDRLRGRAPRLLLELATRALPAEHPAVLDPLDPTRRFDAAYPALAARLLAAMEAPTEDLPQTLIAIARSALTQNLPFGTTRHLDAVATRLA